MACFLIFCVALAVWTVRLWQIDGFVGMLCLTGPAILNGVAYNGVRFIILWLLFASLETVLNRQAARAVRGSPAAVTSLRPAAARRGLS